MATASKTTANNTSTPKTQAQASETAADRVRQTAERGLDVPVGAALSVADRVNEIVEPWTSRKTAERELKSFRTQVTRELNRVERRGASARRRATQRVRTTRNRFERDLKQRRRSVETAVKRNRTQLEKRVREGRSQIEGNLKKAQSTVQERVSSLV
jgi:hypothetical protein